MTQKKEKILDSALQLFAVQGYDGTSTANIAMLAGVSEGLIFKHYTNKQGLLYAILELGKEQATLLYPALFKIEDPLEKIKAIISLPFDIGEEHHYFWKLVYSLKWQANIYDDTIADPIREQLTEAFTILGAEHPKDEADTVIVIIDGVATSVLLRESKNLANIKKSILFKYDNQYKK